VELTAWLAFASLGVPGLALGVFYMLFRRFHWKFPEVSQAWVGPILVLFMGISGGLIYSALEMWAPVRPSSTATAGSIAESKPIEPAVAPPAKVAPAINVAPSGNVTPPSNVNKWRRALVDMRERGKIPSLIPQHYVGEGPVPVWTNREITLKILTRMDLTMDSRLETKRRKIIALVKAAPVPQPMIWRISNLDPTTT
jgi:hypothetical protein